MNNGGMDCMTMKDMEKNMKAMMGNKDHNFYGHMDVNNVMSKKMKKKKMPMSGMGKDK